MEKILIINTIPDSDVSGRIVFNSDFPYDHILTRPRTDSDGIDTTTSLTGGLNQNIPLKYDFSFYPPGNDSSTASYIALTPDYANVILYAGNGGLTMTNYLLTTSNPKYPILITDSYSRWAAPSSRLNTCMIYSANGCYRDYINNQWVVYGQGGLISSIGGLPTQYSNFITSNDGLLWSGMKYNNPYLDSINGYAVDSQSDIGIAIGQGSTYSISILAGKVGNNQAWFPILNSNSLITQPIGIIRGPSWIVYGSTGSGTNALCESINGFEWTGVSSITDTSIITADINQFTNTCMACSSTNFYMRDPMTGTWTSQPISTFFTGLIQISLISNVAVGSQYGMIGSIGTWLVGGQSSNGMMQFFLSTDDGQTWISDNSGVGSALGNYTNTFIGTDSSMNYQDWEFFVNDSNNQLNILELSVTGTNGELALSSYGVVALQGLTGLNVTSYGSIDSKTLQGITYASYLSEINTDLTNALTTPSQILNTTIPDIIGTVSLGSTAQKNATVAGQSTYTSPDLYASFDLTFRTDPYSSKNFTFTDGSTSGNFYSFTINDYLNSSTQDSSIYSFDSNSNQFGGATSGYISDMFNNGLIFAQNIIFGELYTSQIKNLKSLIGAINNINNILSTSQGLIDTFVSPTYGNYNSQFVDGVSGNKELQEFYTPIQQVQNKRIGSYNFDSFEKLQHLSGYPITQTLLTLQDLYNKDGATGSEFIEIVNKFRTLEYYLSYDSTVIDTIVGTIVPNNIQSLPLLVSLLNIINQSLNNNLTQAINNLNNSKTLNTLSNDILTYNSQTTFRFTFDGTFLNLYKDTYLIHQYTIFNSKDLNFKINLSPVLRKTIQIIDQSTLSLIHI